MNVPRNLKDWTIFQIFEILNCWPTLLNIETLKTKCLATDQVWDVFWSLDIGGETDFFGKSILNNLFRPLDDTDYLGDISLDDHEISNDDDQKLFDNNGKLETRKQRSKSAKSASRGKENKTISEGETGDNKTTNEIKSIAKKSKFSKRACSERSKFLIDEYE